MTPAAIFFDFDGVILDSVEIKAEAMRLLFEGEEPDVVDAIVSLHSRHGGVSRFRKFDMIHSDILRRPLSAEARGGLGMRFEKLCFEALLACREIPGARAILEAYAGRTLLFVVSGTPEEELTRIATTRDLARYFVSIHGSPRTKSEILQSLLLAHALDPSCCVFIGDSTTDSDAAGDCGVPFIGVVAPGLANPFAAAIPIVRDLGSFNAALQRVRPLQTVRGTA
jgi:phosphoglycolate phosphatase-like HAD superfamily hydrolase